MKLEIDIPEHHYNNIIAFDSVRLGRVPYKGIIMYAINAIKHGKVIKQEPFKPMVEIDLYSVIKQKYIEREVLEKIRAEINAMFPPSGAWMYEEGHEVEHTVCEVLSDVLQIIDKYKAETEKT